MGEMRNEETGRMDVREPNAVQSKDHSIRVLDRCWVSRV